MAVWPKRPALELYTSPVIDFDGHTARLQLLIPAGWKALAPQKTLKIGTGKSVPDVQMIYIYPDYDEPTAYAPFWINRLLKRLWNVPAEKDPMITLAYGDAGEPPDARLNVTRGWLRGGVDAKSASRSILAPPGAYVEYQRSNLAEFDQTYRQVCESFKVVP